MYNCMRINGWIGALYTISMFFIGNYVALNLFLAILVQNFETAQRNSRASYYESVGTREEKGREGME